MTEYSGFRWALYFLAEYTNMIVVASIATTLFLGGWLRPFSSVRRADFLDYVPMLLMLLVAGYSLYRAPKQPVAVQKMFMVAVAGLCFLMAVVLALPQFAPAGSAFVAMKPGVHGAFWFLLKVGIYLYLFLWLRFTFPRYRFDQLMKLGWHFLIPVSIVNVFGLGVALYLHRSVEEGGYGWGMWSSIAVTSIFTLLIAAWLLKKNEPGPVNPALDEF
jgi:NADH-quinone oxidoreductase subunit H